MLRITFFEIFNKFLDELTFEDAASLGLVDLEPVTLEQKGYDLAGDKADCYMYDKAISVPYHNGKVSVGHKLYFFKNESVGRGLDVEPKVRLTTLLKAYWNYRDVSGGSLSDLEFYFWEGEEDGAVVIEGNIIVRFFRWTRKGAYLIQSFESRLDKTGCFPDVAVRTVRDNMNVFTPECVVSRERAKKLPDAYWRLVGFLCKSNSRSV